jgi:hypothetical protein
MTKLLDPIIPQKDHQAIINAIDGLVLGCTQSCVEIENWMTCRSGQIYKPFVGDPKQGNSPALLGFYPSFSKLVKLTSGVGQMQKHEQLINEIYLWLIPVRMGVSNERDTERTLAGLALYRRYYKALVDSGLMTILKG